MEAILAEGPLWMRIFGAVFWLIVFFGALYVIGTFYHDPNPPY